MDPSGRKPRKPRQRRLYQRRWCRPCKACGTLVVFLDETRPPINGVARGQWALCELYGKRDGVLVPWDGGIAYNPALHILHTDCVIVKTRLRRIIERCNEDL